MADLILLDTKLPLSYSPNPNFHVVVVRLQMKSVEAWRIVLILVYFSHRELSAGRVI